MIATTPAALPAVTPTTVPAVLARGRQLVEPALRASVARLEETSRQVAGYHLGWWDQFGRPTPGAGGKAVRPALALLSAAAAGRPAAEGVPAAVAVELVHNFSLLHDDVMDGDALRRHRPSGWKAFGEPAAILAGDALMVLAIQVVLDSGSPQCVAGVQRLSRAVADLVRGQGEDLAFELRRRVSVEEYLHMAAGKTSALLSAASSLGAELAGGSPELVDGLADFGVHLGIAFQAIDDLLGMWGDPAVTGKPVGSDLRRKKKSLPLVAALGSAQAGDGLVAELDRLLDRETLSDADVERGTALLADHGVRDWLDDVVEGELAAALTALEHLGMPQETHQELTDLARFITTREC